MIQYSTASKNIGVFKEVIEEMIQKLRETANWPAVVVTPVYVFLLSPTTKANIVLSANLVEVLRLKTLLEQTAKEAYAKDFVVDVDVYNKYNKQGKWIGLRATKNKELIEMYSGMTLLVLGLENNLILQP